MLRVIIFEIFFKNMVFMQLEQIIYLQHVCDRLPIKLTLKLITEKIVNIIISFTIQKHTIQCILYFHIREILYKKNSVKRTFLLKPNFTEA